MLVYPENISEARKYNFLIARDNFGIYTSAGPRLLIKTPATAQMLQLFL